MDTTRGFLVSSRELDKMGADIYSSVRPRNLQNQCYEVEMREGADEVPAGSLEYKEKKEKNKERNYIYIYNIGKRIKK